MSNPFDFINKICLIQWIDRGYGDEYNSGGGVHGCRGGIFSGWRITRNGCMVNTLPTHVIHML